MTNKAELAPQLQVPREEAQSRSTAELSRMVRAAGWSYVGGSDDEGLAIRVTPPDEAVLESLPIWEDDGELADGFTIGVDEKTHEKYLDYTGEWGEPMDSLFAAITDIYVQAQNPQ